MPATYRIKITEKGRPAESLILNFSNHKAAFNCYSLLRHDDRVETIDFNGDDYSLFTTCDQGEDAFDFWSRA